MYRFVSTFLGVIFFTIAICQETAWQKNKTSVDSLLAEFREKHCSFLNSNLKNVKHKVSLDTKLFKFLNDFYFGKLDEYSINRTLKHSFQQRPWDFSEIKQQDSVTRYQGRVKSFGNIEAFIGYIVYRNKIIGRRIFFNIRSRLDCLQSYDRAVIDLIYLSDFIPNNVNIPLNFSEWSTYFHSYIWKDPALEVALSKKVDELLSMSNTL